MKRLYFDQGFGAGAGSKSQEPGGSETLRHPLYIILLEVMKAYIFCHSRNITKKFGPFFTIF